MRASAREPSIRRSDTPGVLPRRRRRLALLAGLAAALAQAPSSSRACDAAFEARAHEILNDNVVQRHFPSDVVKRDDVVAEACRLHDAGRPGQEVAKFILQSVNRAFLSFARPDAAPDSEARYGLPFDPVIPRLLVQGNDGKKTHTGRMKFAFDFAMPIGTPVRAARDGVVARVVDGFTKGSQDADMLDRSNRVLVLHADGTFAAYVHLRAGIPVKPGDHVERGQVIARSGNTGQSAGPHLHFDVERVDPDGNDTMTLPIRFGAPGQPGVVPEGMTWVGAPPAPTVDLVLRADGRPTEPEIPVPVHWGQHVRIEVEAHPKGKAARDVTRHPQLELVSMTPWNLDVVGPGEVVLRPMEGYPSAQDVPKGALVSAFFLNRSEGEIGLGKVLFSVVDPGGPPPAAATAK